MPTKFNRWGKPQNYDPSTGRYGEGDGEKSAKFGNFKSPKRNIDIQLFGKENKTEAKVVEISNDNELSQKIISAKSNNEKYNAILNYLKKNFVGKEFVFSDGLKATMDGGDALKLKYNANPKKAAELSVFTELIKNATHDNNAPPYKYHRKFDSFMYYVVTVEYKNKKSDIWIVVGKAKNDGTNHIYDIMPKTKK